uniref:GNAT family N-acetyltransferase n=1 Tax=Gongylonema pulchrum TaxID=637853 RepID=A0A183EP60_9BILA
LPTAMELLSFENPYRLADEQNILEMLQVATEIDHTFTYAERNSEFCFEPNDPTLKGRSIVFADIGPLITVTERYNGIDQSREEWIKTDWNQFLWAIRGKCTFVGCFNNLQNNMLF